VPPGLRLHKDREPRTWFRATRKSQRIIGRLRPPARYEPAFHSGRMRPASARSRGSAKSSPSDLRQATMNMHGP